MAKEIEITLSEKAQRELDELDKKLGLDKEPDYEKRKMERRKPVKALFG